MAIDTQYHAVWKPLKELGISQLTLDVSGSNDEGAVHIATMRLDPTSKLAALDIEAAKLQVYNSMAEGGRGQETTVGDLLFDVADIVGDFSHGPGGEGRIELDVTGRTTKDDVNPGFYESGEGEGGPGDRDGDDNEHGGPGSSYR